MWGMKENRKRTKDRREEEGGTKEEGREESRAGAPGSGSGVQGGEGHCPLPETSTSLPPSSLYQPLLNHMPTGLSQ